MIFTLSNCISLLRAPLAFLFFVDSLFFKTLAIVLAMVTDWLDGYLARRYHSISKLGTILDPLMDKLFVCMLLGYFLYQGQLNIPEVLAFLARDIALVLFGLFLMMRGLWSSFTFRAIWYGKIFTTLQFFILLGLTYGLAIPGFVFMGFVLLGVFSFVELYNALELQNN